MRPTVDRLAAAGYQVRQIDIDREPQLAAQFRVDRVPTFITLVDGQEARRVVGPMSYEQLAQMLIPPSSAVRGQSPDTGFASVGNLNPATPASFAQPAPQPAPPADAARLLEATVKIAVEDQDGTSAGSGTIVDARDGAALVLTCGHLFRTSQGKGPITVTLFQAAPAGAQVRQTVPGRLLHFDLEHDLALVIVNPGATVAVCPVAPANTPITPSQPVTSVGCSQGAHPTAIASRITTLDRYQGTSNIEVAGAPVEGRSGGGLFNASQQLIGVCFAADPPANEGLYASLSAIQSKLDSLNLSLVYQTPQVQSAVTPTSQLAATGPVAADTAGHLAATEVRGQDAIMSDEEALQALTPTPSRGSLSAAERSALEEIQRRGLKAEVICIIRPLDPQGQSEVITLNQVSPQFVDALTGGDVSGETGAAHSTAAAAAQQLLR
jgi:hypothetical protein